MSRIFRCLVCLVLIFSLLVNVSPIRAKATSVATAVVGAAGISLVVAAGMQTLGVRAGKDSSTFSSLVNTCADALSSTWAVNGLTTMLAVTTGTVTKTYASQNFLQAILDWLWNSESSVLKRQNPVYSATETVQAFNPSGGSSGVVSCTVPFFISGYGSMIGDNVVNVYYIIYATSPGSFTYTQNGKIINSGTFSSSGGIYSGSLWHVSGPVSSVTYPYVLCDSPSELIAALDDTISTSLDLTLESAGQEIDTDYETYVDTGIISVDFGIQFEDDPNTDRDESKDNDKPFVPVRLPGFGSDYSDQTQDEAQSGNTPQDVLDEILSSGSGSGGTGSGGSGSGGSGGSGSWSPPSDHNKFALADLSKFFPFCIPFDLFEFFKLLNADPVAPVLSWQIKDLSGRSYSLDIDLAEWDTVALLFRRLQLFLFITGLAVATRKYIKW